MIWRYEWSSVVQSTGTRRREKGQRVAEEFISRPAKNRGEFGGLEQRKENKRW